MEVTLNIPTWALWLITVYVITYVFKSLIEIFKRILILRARHWILKAKKVGISDDQIDGIMYNDLIKSAVGKCRGCNGYSKSLNQGYCEGCTA